MASFSPPITSLNLLANILFYSITALWILQAFYGPLKTWISTRFRERQSKRLAEKSPNFPKRPVALIVAAKGVSPSFAHFLQLVLGQHYENYRIIFVTESESDPARLAIRKHLGLSDGEEYWESTKETGARSAQLVVAGESKNQGQKVHNQLAAFKHLTDNDEIIAFADADIIGGEGWLEKLVTAINVEEAEFTTGYRWFIPEKRTLPNLVAVNINAAIGILAGPSWHALLWGGSMAMTHSAFKEIDVPGNLKGSLNDDLLITRIAGKAGKKLLFIRSLLAPTPVNYDWKALFEFGRRQYFQVRIYVPKFWIAGLIFTLNWTVATIWHWWRFLVEGNFQALWVILYVATMLVMRFILRRDYLRRQFTTEELRLLNQARGLEFFGSTFLHVVHAAIILSSAPIREITWAGIRYRVGGRQKTEVLSR